MSERDPSAANAGRIRRQETASPLRNPLPDSGIVTSPARPGGLLPGAPAEGGGAVPALIRQALGLQERHGNQHVQRLVSAATPTAAIQREETTETTVTVTVGPVQNRTFDVTGATLEAAGQELNARPEWGRGGGENINYSAGTVRKNGTVTSVSITAVLFKELPNWTHLDDKPAAVRNEWNRMLAALTTHEDNHVTIARNAIDGLPAALASVTTQQLRTIWAQEIAALQAAQVKYDADTTNGQTEGVTLDFSLDPNPEEEEEAAGEQIAEGVAE